MLATFSIVAISVFSISALIVAALCVYRWKQMDKKYNELY